MVINRLWKGGWQVEQAQMQKFLALAVTTSQGIQRGLEEETKSWKILSRRSLNLVKLRDFRNFL